MSLLFGSLGHGATLDFLPFSPIGSLARRRSTKWRLHTKNIYQIHTTSHQCSQGKRSELRATHTALTVGDGRESVQNPKRTVLPALLGDLLNQFSFGLIALMIFCKTFDLPKQQITAHILLH